ncbi:hypothetical protein J3Q64DRAFT_1778974 [Phycomyces blakesleeanus]|uniref:EF-hand domain-containing protein n=2 Tax=Phycomyces blakesleeanus TaxID=4837 RepID=A0A162TQZ6_PHYB8|nr:hypothetical protein PHYBLDRAFT_188114 [Phycomyces blakesleeanus NRRL 1555(-)]OAD70372.1 hypothetical protein PHYBLDRAFT_188114 [Phycomyces blakesleeanus NRRL 1555(-)]|eukprot:XP_018288412.1 hypothetical protein PHYBLDRAFT_188114 [Phycomyces blakesleeanus NRRL 1555(-)]
MMIINTLSITTLLLCLATGSNASQGGNFATFEEEHLHDTHQIQSADEMSFFKIHDLNGDGFWDAHELRAMYGLERDIDPDAKHIRTIIDRVFEDLDKDLDGYVSMAEYMTTKLPNWTEEEKVADKMWKEEHPYQSTNENEQNDASQHVFKAEIEDDLPETHTPQWEDAVEEGHIPDKYRD